MQDLEGFTDEQLLLELRRRGRFARVEFKSEVSGYSIAQGMPMKYVIHSAFREAGEALFQEFGPDPKGKIPGFKIEHDTSFNKFAPMRITLPLNIVVEKPDE